MRRLARARATWRRLRRVLARPAVGEVISLNDDWANEASDVPGLLAARQPLGVGVQEGYRTRFRDVLDRRWGVRQRLDSDGTAGVAVIWDRTHLRAIRRPWRDRPHRLGHGWLPMVDAADTRVRGVVWQDVRVRGTRIRFRLASTHRLPQRDRDQWPEQDAALADWLLASPISVVLLMDCNEDGGPAWLLALLRLREPRRFRWVGVGIDGAITDLPTAAAPQALARGTSDHHATSIPLDLNGARP